MKIFKSKPFDKDCRVCGDFNNSPLSIARAITNKVLEKENTHKHDSYEFYIFIKGKAELEVDGKTITATGGDIILIESGEYHKVAKITEETDYITIKK